MKTNNLPPGVALVVDAVGLDEIKPQQCVLMCIKCYVDLDGNLVPYNETLQAQRKELCAEIGKDVFLIKKNNGQFK